MVATDVASRGIGMNDYVPAPQLPFPSLPLLSCGFEVTLCSLRSSALNTMHDLVQALRVFLWFSSQENLGYPVQRGLVRS